MQLSEDLDGGKARIFLEARRVSGWKFIVTDLSHFFFNTRATCDAFQQSGKQDSFGHILKIPANR